MSRDTIVLGIIGMAGLIFVVMHIVWYIKPSDIQTAQQFDAHIQRGEPTVVEFYSNL